MPPYLFLFLWDMHRFPAFRRSTDYTDLFSRSCFFALFSTSKQFIFGVDAAPAAIVGSALASLGIAAESPDALACVPVIAFFAGLWLLLFYCLHADRIVDFISTPVMGGFISGISLTIIFMQIPKLMGSGAGSGELPELLHHIFLAAHSISFLSLAMGISALFLIRIGKKIFPKLPMSIVIMILGVLSTTCFHVQDHGVVLLQAVKPDFHFHHPEIRRCCTYPDSWPRTDGCCRYHGRNTSCRK